MQAMNIAQRSTFVTLVAWLFIALSGFATLTSLLQNIMIQTMFASPRMEQVMAAPAPPGAPAFAAFIMHNMALFFAAFLVVSAVTLAASIGLLLRKNWARITFMAIMALGIAWSVGGLFLQFGMLSQMRDMIEAPPGAPDMGVFFVAIAVVSVLFALGFSALHAWILYRLRSPAIAAEFRVGSDNSSKPTPLRDAP
jgi:hypothetical protein